jgi:hypothetical protein
MGGKKARLKRINTCPCAANAVNAVPEPHGGRKVGLEGAVQVEEDVGEKRNACARPVKLFLRARFGGIEFFALHALLCARARGLCA